MEFEDIKIGMKLKLVKQKPEIKSGEYCGDYNNYEVGTIVEVYKVYGSNTLSIKRVSDGNELYCIPDGRYGECFEPHNYCLKDLMEEK